MAMNYAILDTPIGGDYALVSTFNVSAAAGINITDIPQTYSALEIYVDSILMATSGDLLLRVSTDNGATYLSTAIYTYLLQGLSNSSTLVTYNPAVNQTEVYFWPPAYTLPSGQPSATRITLLNYADAAATGVIAMTWQHLWMSATTSSGIDGWALINVGGPINALSLYNSTGNISGFGRYYGLT